MRVLHHTYPLRFLALRRIPFCSRHKTCAKRSVTKQLFICYPRIAQRDAGRLKWQEKKAAERGERVGEIQERQKTLREKDRATMDAFMKMAKERFG